MKQETKNYSKILKGAMILAISTTVGNAFYSKPAEAVIADMSNPKMSMSDYMKLQEIQYKKFNVNSDVVVNKVDIKPVFHPIDGDLTVFNLTTPSHLTGTQIDKVLAKTRLRGLGWAYAEAEKRYGINALYLLAHSALESGWGTSTLSHLKNNLFGFQAYDASPGESAKSFNTKANCILIVGKYISEEYLDKAGDHYNGDTLSGMNQKYASDDSWAFKIADIMKMIQEKITTEAA